METQQLDWAKAERHFNMIYDAYKDLPVNVGFFGLTVFREIKRRFDAGERTPELFQEMMDVE